jgi:hypothetical protein
VGQLKYHIFVEGCHTPFVSQKKKGKIIKQKIAGAIVGRRNVAKVEGIIGVMNFRSEAKWMRSLIF